MATSSPANLDYQQSHIHDDRRGELIACYVIALVIMYIAGSLRCISRRLARTPIGWDDGIMMIAVLLGTLWNVFGFIMIHYGVGRHSIVVTDYKNLVISTLIGGIFYINSNCAIKISILLFYRRLFRDRWLKKALIAVGVFAIAQDIALSFAEIFVSVPISAQWDPTVRGRYLNFSALAIVSGLLNVLTDILILILPIPIVFRLNMPNTRKWQVYLTFLLGGLVCVISIVRLGYWKSWGGADTTYNHVVVLELCSLEIGVGVLSACLPLYHPIYNYFFHGKATANATSARTKPRRQTSSNRKQLKLAAMARQWPGNPAPRLSDDEERLHDHFGTVTQVKGKEEGSHEEVYKENDILVTRQFATSTSNTSAV